MGTLSGHLLPGAAFSLLGLWHLINTSASYRLSGRSSFSSRTWFPSPFIKHLELLLLLLLSLFSSIFLLFFSPSSPSNLEHTSMFLHLIIYSSAALATDLLPSPSSLPIVGVLAASAFAQQLLLLHFHSIDHTGIEGHYHSLMEIVVAVCLVSTVVTVGFPTSYEVAVVRSAAVALQGMWFACMGLVLWGPERFLPTGCEVEGGVVVCAGAGAGAAATANVQFSWMVAGVAAVTTAICLAPEGRGIEYRKLGSVGRNSGDGEGGGGGVKPQV